MQEPNPGEPWAFIAHKDGGLAGVASATLPKRELKKFLGEFASDGYSIMTVHSREEYNTALAGFKSHFNRPALAE